MFVTNITGSHVSVWDGAHDQTATRHTDVVYETRTGQAVGFYSSDTVRLVDLSWPWVAVASTSRFQILKSPLKWLPMVPILDLPMRVEALAFVSKRRIVAIWRTKPDSEQLWGLWHIGTSQVKLIRNGTIAGKVRAATNRILVVDKSTAFNMWTLRSAKITPLEALCSRDLCRRLTLDDVSNLSSYHWCRDVIVHRNVGADRRVVWSTTGLELIDSKNTRLFRVQGSTALSSNGRLMVECNRLRWNSSLHCADMNFVVRRLDRYTHDITDRTTLDVLLKFDIEMQGLCTLMTEVMGLTFHVCEDLLLLW